MEREPNKIVYFDSQSFEHLHSPIILLYVYVYNLTTHIRKGPTWQG